MAKKTTRTKTQVRRRDSKADSFGDSKSSMDNIQKAAEIPPKKKTKK